MSVYQRPPSKIWWVKFQRDGQTIRKSSGSRIRRVAEKYERELKEECARISRGGKPRRTFEEMMERFVKEHLPTLKYGAQRRYIVSIKNLRLSLGGLYLDQINKGKISDFISRRKKTVASATIRRDLACLSSAFEDAVGWDWCDMNPVKHVSKRTIPEPLPRTRYLSRDEYIALLAGASDHLVPLIRFAVATGLRFEEQFSLTWEQVNRTRKELSLVDTKTGTPRIVPLTEDALAVIDGIAPYYNSPYIFYKDDGSRYGTVKTAFKTAIRRAKIKDLRWHDLRRTCGSWMLQNGVDIFTVSRWLGHKSVATTERAYAFLDTASLHRAGTLMGTRATD